MTDERQNRHGPVPKAAWRRKSVTDVRYKIDLDERSYLTLLRLVMKYASGTGVDTELDATSSIAMRVDLANATRYIAKLEDPLSFVVSDDPVSKAVREYKGGNSEEDI